MPTPFAITAASNSIFLDKDRRATAAFTITNVSGRPLRGRVRLTFPNEAVAPWVSVVGAAERDFAIAASQQITVQVAVPPAAPPGQYTFRLDMVGVDNPDEEFAEGPSVAFDVPQPVAPKPFPFWILGVGALVLLLLVGGGVGAYIITRPTPTPIPHASPTPTSTVTATPLPNATPTDTPTPTATPLFGTGLITLKQSEGGGVSIYAVSPGGARVALVQGMTDAEVLDFAPAHNRFALWVNQGGQQSVVMVNADGSGSVTLNQGWATVTDAMFAPTGDQLIVQAVGTDNQTHYYFFDVNGTLLNTVSLAAPAGALG